MNIREILEKEKDIYVECHSGWDWLIEEIHNSLSYLDKDYRIDQIKQKYATLRFYYEPTDEALDNTPLRKIMDVVVDYYEWLSAYTCESCGNCSKLGNSKIKLDKTVKTRGDWYIYTSCDTCEEKKKETNE